MAPQVAPWMTTVQVRSYKREPHISKAKGEKDGNSSFRYIDGNLLGNL
ncbi:hypothetical protein SAMN02745220_04547 [Desulfopila aestuarii DSM 18488]|uniref:Uncharacterized protein n=1 Tax=Desulfopila aestuarii DSM 18488 TaxID=1121416 RepID=A0A1M7YID7_9BACT|nr:hypothetical protein SAMN02745220_04547 [Desulfopila aestuarii DSM 18488]